MVTSTEHTFQVVDNRWLTYDPSLPDEINFVSVPRKDTKTRVEEYHYALSMYRAAGKPLKILDAGAGYVPNWHVLPYILVTERARARVCAVDNDSRSLNMPPHPNIRRDIGDMTSLPYGTNAFNFIACISTLEHLAAADRQLAMVELQRVLEPGGMIVVTADNYPGITPTYLLHLLTGSPNDDEHNDDPETFFPGRKRVATCVVRSLTTSTK